MGGVERAIVRCTLAWSVPPPCGKRYPSRRPDSPAADGTQRNLKSTALAEAKSVLHGVKESSNAYLPLKSIAERLCIILDNCEVWPSTIRSAHEVYDHSSKRT